ncbi:hypothetical protein WA588_002927 [Blastocystis sp. NMH]
MLPLIFLFFGLSTVVLAGEDNHIYSPGDKLYAWTNRIGPYHNPHETYDYFDLPFCKPLIPDILATKKGGISEMIEGTTLQNSGIVFSFGQNSPRSTLCTAELTTEQTYKMQMAIANHYWYLMEVDGLPIWAKVGDLDISEEKLRELESHGTHHDVMPEHSFIYTHRHFSFGFNGDRIVEVNMTASDPQLVEADKPLIFSVSSSWSPSTGSYARRFDRYLESSFFESQIHWFSVLNSFMIVVFLAGLVALIMMRTLSLDYSRYTQAVDGDDTGWKRIHGDVFRPCPHWPLFAVLMGTGAHIVATVVLSLLLILLITRYVGHDSVILLVVIVYFATFFVNGFVSGAVFRQGFFPRVSPGWQRVAFISAGLGPFIVLVVYCALCAIAVVHRNIPSFPRKTLALLLALFLFVALPLQLAGTVLGRNLRGNPHNPCRITAVPSPVPRAAFYATPRFIALVSGLIPFGSIFIEIFFLFASLWSYKYYYVYGFLAAMTAILVIIESCVSIVGTYILLNAENHHWRWTSFLSGASIGVYLFLYCVYFYCCKTQMNGFVQAAYFFGESLLLVLLVALFCGVVSTAAATMFVRQIFTNIKVD